MSAYVAEFHSARPGITEAVLGRCLDDRLSTPYGWLMDAVRDGGPVLDLACGSAPLWPALAGRRYLGLDTSAAELGAARGRGAHPRPGRCARRIVSSPPACAWPSGGCPGTRTTG